MKESKIIRTFRELDMNIMKQNMALNKFAQEATQHLNTLVLSFNAVKTLLEKNNIMTTEEINEQIIVEIDKAKKQHEDSIKEEIIEEDVPIEEVKSPTKDVPIEEVK